MLEMLSYGFLQNAFLAGLMIALIAPVIGVYIVLRRQSLMAETLSHVSLAGVAVGTLIGVYPMFTALIASLIGAVLVDTLRRSFRAYSELSIAILMSGGLATAVVLMSLNKSGSNRGFTSYLFGSIIAVSEQDLLVMAGVLVVCLLFFWLLWKPMYVTTFDEETAQVSGIPVKTLSISFSILSGLVVAVAMPIVGVLLVSSLMVLPAAIALRVTKGFAMAIGVAVMVGVFCVLGGLTASYQLDIPPGGTIVLFLLTTLVTVLGVKKLYLFFQARFGRNADNDASIVAVEER